MTRRPRLAPHVQGTTVVVRPRVGEGHDPYAVTLHPVEARGDAWEVYLDNGDLTSHWVGTVERYTGSIDRRTGRGGRLRAPGKARTLWACTSTEDGARFWGKATSRADAIRRLVGPR